jgi:hypothetical protein
MGDGLTAANPFSDEPDAGNPHVPICGSLRLHRLAVAEIDHAVEFYEARQPVVVDNCAAETELAAALGGRRRASGKRRSADGARR